MGAVTRKERDKKLRQADIFEAAERVFAVKGFHRATMQDIAREAEYGIGTLYLYFKDKDELYLSLIDEKMGTFIGFVRSRVKETETPRGQLKALIYAHLAFFQEHRDFFGIYFSERERAGQMGKGKFSKQFLNTFLDYLEYVTGIIKECTSKGLVRKHDSKQMAFMLVSMMNSMVYLTLREKTGEDLTHFADFVIDVFLNGVAAKK